MVLLFANKRHSANPKTAVICIQNRSVLVFVHSVLHDAREIYRLRLGLQLTAQGNVENYITRKFITCTF